MTAPWRFAAALFALVTTAAQSQELPKGWGSSSSGVFIFRHKCESCHHEWGGRTVGASTGLCFVDPVRLFHYVKSEMPPDAPGSLKDTEVYHLVAFVLDAKGIIPRNALVTAQTLPKVAIPIPASGMISSGCPKAAGGLGKYESMKDSRKTMPALLPASAAAAPPPPPTAAAKPKPTKLTPQ